MFWTTTISFNLVSCYLFLCWEATPVQSNHNYGPMRKAGKPLERPGQCDKRSSYLADSLLTDLSEALIHLRVGE